MFTHSVIMVSAYVFQARLYAVHDPRDRARVLLALLPLEDDTRVADDCHGLPS